MVPDTYKHYIFNLPEAESSLDKVDTFSGPKSVCLQEVRLYYYIDIWSSINRTSVK